MQDKLLGYIPLWHDLPPKRNDSELEELKRKVREAEIEAEKRRLRNRLRELQSGL